MDRNAVLIGKPQKRSDVVGNRMVYSPTVFGYFNPFEPLRESLHHILLKKSRLTNAAMKSFHRDGAIANVRQHDWSDLFVIVGKLRLRDAFSWKEDLLGMGDQIICHMS